MLEISVQEWFPLVKHHGDVQVLDARLTESIQAKGIVSASLSQSPRF